jgi:hypothetical protein
MKVSFQKNQDIFSLSQYLQLNLDQNKFDDNVKLINYREPFHTFKKLISYILRAFDKQLYRKQIAHVLKFKAIVSGSATFPCHLQRVSVVKDIHGLTVAVKNKW